MRWMGRASTSSIEETDWTAVDDFAVRIDEDQIGCYEMRPRNPEGIHPEARRVYGILDGDQI
jgi:hypothetical protein